MAKSTKVYIDHHIAQLEGINPQLLNHKKTLLETCFRIAQQTNLTIVKSFVHKFKPHGLSLVLVISESHFAVHTWPELGYMHVDVLSCSSRSKLGNLEKSLREEFKPLKISCKKINY